MNDDRKKKNIIQTLCSYVYMTAYEKKATKVVTLRSSWKMLEALHSVELSLILSDSHTNDICIYALSWQFICLKKLLLLGCNRNREQVCKLCVNPFGRLNNYKNRRKYFISAIKAFSQL